MEDTEIEGLVVVVLEERPKYLLLYSVSQKTVRLYILVGPMGRFMVRKVM